MNSAESLIEMLVSKVDYIILDHMNYHHADKVYSEHGWRDKNTDEYFDLMKDRITNDCSNLGIDCRTAY
jgi:hypothetical protein